MLLVSVSVCTFTQAGRRGSIDSRVRDLKNAGCKRVENNQLHQRHDQVLRPRSVRYEEKDVKTLVAASPGELAVRVADALNARPGHERYRQLPYNRFDGYLDHLYWLVPGSERVAFNRSKYFVDWWDQDSGMIWFGIHMEKGLGPNAARSKSDPWRMGKEWAWHTLVPEVGSSLMRVAIKNVGRLLGGTGQVTVLITPGVEGIDRKNCQVTGFALSTDASLALEKASGVLHLNLSACRTLEEIRDALQGWPESEWFWVDIFLGFRAKIETARCVDQNAQARELAKEVFAPLEPWVR